MCHRTVNVIARQFSCFSRRVFARPFLPRKDVGEFGIENRKRIVNFLAFKFFPVFLRDGAIVFCHSQLRGGFGFCRAQIFARECPHERVEFVAFGRGALLNNGYAPQFRQTFARSFKIRLANRRGGVRVKINARERAQRVQKFLFVGREAVVTDANRGADAAFGFIAAPMQNFKLANFIAEQVAQIRDAPRRIVGELMRRQVERHRQTIHEFANFQNEGALIFEARVVVRDADKQLPCFLVIQLLQLNQPRVGHCRQLSRAARHNHRAVAQRAQKRREFRVVAFIHHAVEDCQHALGSDALLNDLAHAVGALIHVLDFCYVAAIQFRPLAQFQKNVHRRNFRQQDAAGKSRFNLMRNLRGERSFAKPADARNQKARRCHADCAERGKVLERALPPHKRRHNVQHLFRRLPFRRLRRQMHMLVAKNNVALRM
ncbi:MAG: hypothetical protein HDKAJFGB_02657 [Anaerolineae bacterium]|nr:hypothetical protein [Anaerolineae bacterium]